MNEQMLTLIKRSMDEQLTRKHYPEGYPALPDLPASRFSNRDFAETEIRSIWKKTWLMAGLESDLPQAGSYFLFEKLGLSVLVSRGKDGAVRAFHNICSHRGSALLVKPKGTVMRLVCPYHAWGYGLGGQLETVPGAHEFACLDKSVRGLKSVRCETWRGLIFINLDPLAESLPDFLLPVAAHTAGFPLEGLVIQDHFFVEMECNWKIAYHNFIEAYHVAMVHPKSLAPYLDPQSWVASLLENGHARIAVNKPQGDSIYKTDVTATDSIDEVFKRFTITLSIFPNTSITLDPSGFAIQSFWPAAVGKSILEVRLVGWASNPADRDYWSAMRATVEAILAEDLRLFASIQRGMESGHLPKIVMGYRERALYWFEEEIDRRIGVENIPEDMRVTPVLAGQVGR
jgi:phenylpropionate dioxygenase-like ring-hydroxylating dioxygenase large terminal subunit